MYGKIKNHIAEELKAIEEGGIYKRERIITTPQGANVQVSSGENVVIMCANNYLGLSSHPEVIKAAKDTLDSHGFGMSSVRFICGTQDIHKELEEKIANFYGTEDTICMQQHLTQMEVYSSRFSVRKMQLFLTN